MHTLIENGEDERRLSKLRTVIDEFGVRRSWIHATHIERSEALLREAIELAGRGAAVDTDTVDGELARWLRFYVDHGGDPDQLTVSSDASIDSPRALAEQVCDCIVNHGFPIEQVLPLVTSNTARILAWEEKGTLERGKMADVPVLERDTFQLRHVWSKGERMVRDGELVARAGWLAESKRDIVLVGDESPASEAREPAEA